MEIGSLKTTNPWFLVATCFGLGTVPWAPGTWGSGVGVFLYWITRGFPFWAKLIFLALLTFLGTLASQRIALAFGQEDPSAVIIDEVAGAYLALLGHPADPLHLLVGFFLFRFFDIWKPWPIRATERLPGGFGIMADDLAAGGLSNVVLFLILW